MNHLDLLELAIRNDNTKHDSFFEEDKTSPKIKQLIDYFYQNHPVKGLVRNRAQDTLITKRMLEYCDYQQVFDTIKYMHVQRKCDYKHIQLLVNEAVQYQQYVRLAKVENTCANLVCYFYSLYENKFESPNFVKECVQVDQNLEKHTPEEIRKIMNLMVAKRHTDLRMFNYVRNEYLSKRRDEIKQFTGVIEFD